MANFIVLVLDGFGIGCQSDVAAVRPADLGANTLKSLLKHQPDLNLPNLAGLGLMNAAGFESDRMKFAAAATVGRSMLTHFGADTFWGHQEIMGTRPRKSKVEPISQCVGRIKAALEDAGHQTRLVKGENGRFLVVDNAMTIADNIESDPGLAINITAALDSVPFEKVVEVGRIVRGLVSVSRVIAFGGSGVSIDQILNARVEMENGFIGISAPKSGVYEKDYQCVHLGYKVDPQVQITGLLHQADIPSVLIGKVADIVHNPIPSDSYPMVPTEKVMRILIEKVRRQNTAFLCANVQETDLSGHRQDADAYIRVLNIVDDHLPELLGAMGREDILVVMADHGNDPGIGHSHHTREMVPLLFAGAVGKGIDLGTRDTLSDVAATAAEFFNVPMPENGVSFLKELLIPQNAEDPSQTLRLRIDLMRQNGTLTNTEEKQVLKLVAFFRDEFGIEMTEENGAALLTHFAMLLNRLRLGEAIAPMPADLIQSMASEPRFPLAERTKERIRAEIAHFPPEEDGYILAHLINLFNQSESG